MAWTDEAQQLVMLRAPSASSPPFSQKRKACSLALVCRSYCISFFLSFVIHLFAHSILFFPKQKSFRTSEPRRRRGPTQHSMQKMRKAKMLQ